MRNLTIAVAIGALAACGNPSADSEDIFADESAADIPEPAEPQMTQIQPGSYDVMQNGQMAGSTMLNADGTYTDTGTDGSTMTGTWEQNAQGQLCFDPDGAEGPTCWTNTPQPDGSWVSSNDAGDTVTIRASQSQNSG